MIELNKVSLAVREGFEPSEHVSLCSPVFINTCFYSILNFTLPQKTIAKHKNWPRIGPAIN